MKKLRVAVLMGGESAERDVSLNSGQRVAAALDSDRYDVLLLDLPPLSQSKALSYSSQAVAHLPAKGNARENPHVPALDSSKAASLAKIGPRLPEPILKRGVDVVFLALHGGMGENGTIQGALELLGLPYTGSGVLASALGMDKVRSRNLFRCAGIPTPRDVVFGPADRNSLECAARRAMEELGLPLVMKPSCQGSSVGITIARKPEEVRSGLETAYEYDHDVIAEDYLKGMEISVPVLGNRDPQVLPVVEIVPKTSEFYDYHAKYTPGATEEIVPARISETQTRRAQELALKAYQALGCRGMARVDMIVTPEDIYVLELNTIPGLTETSILPRAAEAAGISFAKLVEKLIDFALEEVNGPAREAAD